MVVLGEKPNRDLVNPIRDEIGGKDIDRIMQMAEQDDNAKENGDSQKKPAKLFVVPKNQRQEEREACMPREEQIPREGDLVHDAVVDVERGLMQRRSYVGQDNEKGADSDEEAQSFEHKGDASWKKEHQAPHKYKKQHNPIDKNAINIEGGDMIQNEVVDRIAGIGRRVSPRQIVGNEAERQKCHPP